MLEKLTANFIADALNVVYKSKQTDKRKGIKTVSMPLIEKGLKVITKEVLKK